MMNATPRGRPKAGNPHVRFDAGEVAPPKPGRGSLRHVKPALVLACALAGFCSVAETAPAELVKVKGTVFLSELEKYVVEPTWHSMPYETVDGIRGRLYCASHGMRPLTRIEFNLPVKGRYRIHLGFSAGRGGGYMTMVRLSSDPAPVLIDASADTKDASFWMQPVECDWKVADLNNDRLILENLPRHASVLAWIRLVPTDERIGPPRRDHDMIATNDGYCPASSFDEILAPIMRLKDSPVTEIHYCVGNGIFSFAAPSRVALSCASEPGAEYQDERAKNTAKTYEWLRCDHPHLVDELADFTHSIGMKFMVSFRTGCTVDFMRAFELADRLTPEKTADHIRRPETYCRLWDGTPVLRPSYANPAVQDFFLRFYAEQLTDKVDGLSLIWQRAMPAMLFEKSFRDRFMARYGEELKSPEDPRVRTLRAEILTDYIGKVRKLAGKRKLTIFVGPDRETNEKFGLDLRRLAAEGLVDEFVPGYSKQDARHSESIEYFEYKYLREAVAGTKTKFRTMFWGEANHYANYVGEGAVGVANWDAGNHPWSVWERTRLLYDRDGSLQRAWTDAHPREKAVHPFKTLNGFDYFHYPYHVAY